jgi:guanylate kinase
MVSAQGLLLVISGPSGSGKGTIIKRLMEKNRDFRYSVSATTRCPRAGEIDGMHYFFIGREDFENRIQDGMMLEYAEYCGNYYGTPKKELFEFLDSGKNVILEIEVQGAMQVKEKFPGAVFIMIAPPDFKTLESRLRGRGDNVPEEVILKRLEAAKCELSMLKEYDYIVVNGNDMIDQAADEIICIANAEKHRVIRRSDFLNSFFAQ